MRNLKRALSLGLTAAMISGLMVMGSSAASYADVTSENNQEAIDVLQTVGIMVGDENGNFNPDQNVTRNEMAVIMANLMEYNVATYKDTSPFTDVPSWAEPYVAACYTNGITSGYSDTIYGGSDTVTTAQAALMLMKALGYFQYASDFGSDWQLATTRQGNAIDLFVGVDSGVTQAMTRDDVAQLVLNTLQAGTVQASTDGSWTIGDVTINNNVTYDYITSNADYAYAISSDASTTNTTDTSRSIVELGEQLYMGDLQLNENAMDAFGRPSRYWEYDGDEIGTYVKKELLRESYTTEVTGRDLYELLGSSLINDNNYDFTISVDGETDESVLTSADFDYYFTQGNLVRTNTNGLGGTDDGVLTEVYVDVIDKEVSIAIINTYLAIVDGDYDEDDDELDLDVYGIEDQITGDSVAYQKNTEDRDSTRNGLQPYTENMTVSGEDFAIADYLDEDIVLVTVAQGEVQTLADPETMDAVTLDAFKIGSYVETEGTQYDYASTLVYDPEVLDIYTDGGDNINLKDITYNLYLDPYGYLIGVEQNEDPTQYLFLTGMDKNTSNLGNRTADANVIFLDGTMATVEVNLRDSEEANGADFDLSTISANMNIWCTYTVNSNDVYTLTKVERGESFNSADDKAGQARYYDNATTAPDDDWWSIDESHVALSGVDYNDGAAVGSEIVNPITSTAPYYWVYGNDESIYITVEIDDAVVEGSVTQGIVTDVDSVVTGVQNANLNVYNGAYAKALVGVNSTPQGVYTLFDDDGYVIAAIVVGEDAGATTSYAYVTSSNVNRESYNGEWAWTREVVINGELTEITYTGDSLDEIDTTVDSNGDHGMRQGNWYEVRYYADGTVKSTRLLDGADPEYFSGTAGTPFQNAVNDIINGNHDTVLLENVNPGALTLRGSTLYTATSDNQGIAISSDVKVVRAQNIAGTAFDEIEEYDGVDGLEDAINDMYDNFANGTGVDHELVVIVENGRATSVILVNDTPEPVNGGTTTPRGYTVVGGSATDNFTTARIYAGSNTWNLATATDTLADYIRGQGYNVTNVNASTNQITFMKNNTPTTINVTNNMQVVRISDYVVYSAGSSGSGYTLDTNWNVTGGTEYVGVGDVLNLTISHSGWGSGSRNVGMNASLDGVTVGVVTSTGMATVSPTDHSAQVTLTVGSISGDGDAVVYIYG